VVTSRRAGGNAFLPELELNVSTELTQAGTGQPGGEAAGGPDGEQLPDPGSAPPAAYAAVAPETSGPAADGLDRGALASVTMDVTCRASSSGTVTAGTSASGSILPPYG
jgi:hypothetical protein